jgi:hypothetical protein
MTAPDEARAIATQAIERTVRSRQRAEACLGRLLARERRATNTLTCRVR